LTATGVTNQGHYIPSSVIVKYYKYNGHDGLLLPLSYYVSQKQIRAH